MEIRARVNSTDVAREAGVSRATVSYVLNETPDQSISAETREAVRRAARKLGYTPHPGARSLRKGRSDIALFPFPGVEMTHVFATMVDASARALTRHHLTLVADLTLYETPRDRVNAWLRLGPAAVIDLILRRDDPALSALRRAGVSVVSPADAPGPASQRPLDTISDRAREVQVEYLLEIGRRDIVFALPAEVRRAYTGARRQMGMRRAVRHAGARLRFQDVELDRAGMRAAVRSWCRESSRPDAICAYNDELAIGLLSALSEAGIGVPRDVAVIGVDDIPLGSVITPALTTVTWSVEELGESIADATAALITGKAASQLFVWPEFHVAARESA